MSPIVNFDDLKPKNPWEIIVDPGWYPCRIGSVEEQGDDKWRIRLNHMCEPAFEATDYLRFSGKALERVKILYEGLGFPCESRRDCKISDIEGREVLVCLEPETWKGQTRMKVVFDGYKPIGKNNRTVSPEQRPSPPSAVAQPVAIPDGEEIPF